MLVEGADEVMKRPLNPTQVEQAPKQLQTFALEAVVIRTQNPSRKKILLSPKVEVEWKNPR